MPPDQLASRGTRDRPLSPHLQVYKPQLTSILSISHRASGLVLVVGMLVLAWWLIAASVGPDAFATAQRFLGSWLGLLLLFGWSVALFYHLANGIRHLFWDAGYGYDIVNAYRSGWAVVAMTAALTLIAWIAGIAAWGGRS